jgi:threonine dehydratase
VVHERISPSLNLDEVEVHLQLETRGEPHAEKVLTRLRERGYRIHE